MNLLCKFFHRMFFWEKAAISNNFEHIIEYKCKRCNKYYTTNKLYFGDRRSWLSKHTFENYEKENVHFKSDMNEIDQILHGLIK